MKPQLSWLGLSPELSSQVNPQDYVVAMCRLEESTLNGINTTFDILLPVLDCHGLHMGAPVYFHY